MQPDHLLKQIEFTKEIDKLSFDQVYRKKQVINNGSSHIWEYAEQLINDSLERGILKKM
jgi:putative hydrolase of HD superfamily